MLENWPQFISYASAGLLVYIVVGVFVVFFVPLSRAWTRLLCNTGVSAALLLAVNGGVLFFWHEYFR